MIILGEMILRLTNGLYRSAMRRVAKNTSGRSRSVVPAGARRAALSGVYGSRAYARDGAHHAEHGRADPRSMTAALRMTTATGWKIVAKLAKKRSD